MTNLILHILNAVLFYFLIVMFLRQAGVFTSDNCRYGVQISAVVGTLFFANHPLRVESVAWISTRGDVLCGFFYLFSVMAYLKMVHEEGTLDRRKWIFVSLLFFTLSLLSRAWGITFPLVLLILDVYPLRRFAWDGKLTSTHKKLLIEKIPFALLALGAGILAFLAKMGDMLPVANHGVFDRFVQATYGLSFYVMKTILPVGLSPLYLLDKNFDGYNEIDREHYDRGFNLVNPAVYNVKDEFPRIRKNDVREGIIEVSYRIDLTEAEQYEEKFNTMIEKIKGYSDVGN